MKNTDQKVTNAYRVNPFWAIKEREVESVKELKELDSADPEVSHSKADDILIEFLYAAGYKKIADAWKQARDNIGFWYA